MKKFELRQDTIEVKWKERNIIKKGVTLNQADSEPTIIKKFDYLDEALQELKSYKSSINELSGYFVITEYYVQENEYDEEGELLNMQDIAGISEMEISLTEKPSYKVVKTFDNMKDAEAALDDCISKGREAFLSYI